MKCDVHGFEGCKAACCRIWLKTVTLVMLALFFSTLSWGASQDFKGTINGNTITAGSGTVTMSAGKTLTVTQTTSLDEAVSMSSKATQTNSAWTPTANRFTVVGAETISGHYTKTGNVVTVWIYYSAATTVAAVATTSYFANLPFNPVRNSISMTMLDDQTAVGLGFVQAGTNKMFVSQLITATNRTIIMTATYEVQ